jgi:hypothetical protein
MARLITGGAVVRKNNTVAAPSLLSRTNSSAMAALATLKLRRRASTGNMPSDENKKKKKRRQRWQLRPNSSIDLGDDNDDDGNNNDDDCGCGVVNADDDDDDDDSSIASTDSESEDLIIEEEVRSQNEVERNDTDFQKMEQILSSLSKALSLSSARTPAAQQTAATRALPLSSQQQTAFLSPTSSAVTPPPPPPPLVVEEERFTTCDMTLLGSIEIQLVRDPARQCEFIPRIRITCFPNGGLPPRRATTMIGRGGVGGGVGASRDMITSNDDDDDDDEDDHDENDFYAYDDAALHSEGELPQSMMDHFTSTFMETCAVDTSSSGHQTAATFTPKSALRSKQHYWQTQPASFEYHDDVGLEKKNSVSFDKVDIHEFLMTLGDHPSAASGPPVAIDWEHKIANHNSLNLDDYERSRHGVRRSRKDLKLSLRDRKGILLGPNGRNFSNQEVHLAWQEARNIRKQRRETLRRGVFLMVYDDMIESANRKMSRFADSITLCSCFAC